MGHNFHGLSKVVSVLGTCEALEVTNDTYPVSVCILFLHRFIFSILLYVANYLPALLYVGHHYTKFVQGECEEGDGRQESKPFTLHHCWADLKNNEK
jgi:hypothetical protein